MKISDDKILDCCNSILNFILEVNYPSPDTMPKLPTPAQKIMNSVLTENGYSSLSGGGNMIYFIEDVNLYYKLNYILQENNSYSKFFKEKSRGFLRQVIREIKLNKVL